MPQAGFCCHCAAAQPCLATISRYCAATGSVAALSGTGYTMAEHTPTTTSVPDKWRSNLFTRNTFSETHTLEGVRLTGDEGATGAKLMHPLAAFNVGMRPVRSDIDADSHLVDTVVDSIAVSCIISESLTFEHADNTVTILGMRPVINGSYAGPLQYTNKDLETVGTLVNTDAGKLQYRIYSEESLPTYLINKHWKVSQSLTLDADTTIGAGDVVGFDIWVEVFDRTGPVGPPGPVKDKHYVAIWNPGEWEADSVPVADSNQITWLHDAIGANFNANRHTYKFDFSGQTGWNPTGNDTWIPKRTHPLLTTQTGCSLAAESPLDGIVMTLSWNAEVPTLTIEGPPAGNYTPGPGIFTSVTRVHYQPWDEGGWLWGAASTAVDGYQVVYRTDDGFSHTHPSGTRRPGEFDGAGTTIFRPFMAELGSLGEIFTYYEGNADLANTSHIKGHADVPEYITVTRV